MRNEYENENEVTAKDTQTRQAGKPELIEIILKEAESRTVILKHNKAISFMREFDERYKYKYMNITVYINKDKVTVYDESDNTLIYEDFIKR